MGIQAKTFVTAKKCTYTWSDAEIWPDHFEKIQIQEQKGHKLNGRAARLLGQPWAALAPPVQTEDGNNSLGALGIDHRTSTALGPGPRMTFPVGQSVLLLQQKVWETGSQEKQLEGTRIRESGLLSLAIGSSLIWKN